MSEGETLSEKIYLIYNNLDVPTCANPNCNNKTNFLKFSKGYTKACCPSCGQKNPKTRNKIEKTNLNKYGTKTPLQSNEIKEKIEKTNLNRYGTKYACQSNEIKEKIKETNLKKYGVNNPNKCKKIRDKIDKTNLKRYGSKVAIPFGSDKYKDIIKEKYGVEYYQQTDEYREIMQDKLNYKEIHKKVKQTKLSRYNDEFYTNRIKANKTIKEKYGVNHISQVEEFQNKKKQTMKSRYGVEYIAQVPIFHKKQMSAFGKKMRLKEISETLHYQTIPELECIKCCQSQNIDIWDGPSIFYEFENKQHIYHIDFETDKYIIEIKSSHGWYKENLASGKIDAKNTAAQEYAALISKEFKFLLDVKDYYKYI